METWDEVTRELNRLQGISMSLAASTRKHGSDEPNKVALAQVSETTQQLRTVLETEVWQYRERNITKQNVESTIIGELGRLERTT